MPDSLRFAVPRWSCLARTGAPSAGGLFPFDPELAQLELGARSVIKRETRTEEERVQVESWFFEHGLDVLVAGSVVLAGRDEARLARARDAELAGDRDAVAVRELGALLGYPSCCIEAYLALPVRDDAALFSALLPSPPVPAPPETLWLIGPLSLLAHTPCSLVCPASYELGRSTLARLDRETPGFDQRWRALARRVHVIDDLGRALSFELEGTYGAGEVGAASRTFGNGVPCVEPCSPPDLARVRFVADHRGERARLVTPVSSS